MYPLFIGVPGGPELLVILGIAILLFGADRLPKLARSSGQAMGEFKKGRQEIEDEIRSSAARAKTGSDAPAETEVEAKAD
ncbi:MAG: twin-arginine translocase TatA/TatE family subunit [Haloarculaceae archaeon]